MSLVSEKNKILADQRKVKLLYSNEQKYNIYEHSVMIQKSQINYTFEGFDDGSRDVMRVCAFGAEYMRLMRKEMKMPKYFHNLFLYRFNKKVKQAILLAAP